MLDLHNLLRTLSNNRPIFHSEADFQHALAWQIHEEYPEYSIRLEHCLSPGEREHLDILAFDEHDQLAIELKYKKRRLFASIGGEVFWLKDYGAEPLARYDFLSDIQRLEQFASTRQNVTGYAILITNNSSYWNPPRSASSVDASFRIHEGEEISGILRWEPKALKGTTKDREKPITIKGTYKLMWHDYHEVESGTNVEGYRKFRYLLVKIGEL